MFKMDFKKQSEIFKSVLELKYEPIAVIFTNDQVSTGKYEKTPICKAVKLASEGDSYIVDEETSTCPGGSRYCGFSDTPSKDEKRRLQNFLTNGEKLTSSIVSFERMQKLSVEPPTGLSDRIIICPLSLSEKRPDLVLFLVNPEQACRLVTLDTYWDGLSPDQHIIGALCHTAISYTLMTGNTNLSMGDWTARHHQGFDPDILFLSIPFERIDNLLKAVPHCSAGDASVLIPDDF
jgi:uncharacterized protein (DUF169 family)